MIYNFVGTADAKSVTGQFAAGATSGKVAPLTGTALTSFSLVSMLISPFVDLSDVVIGNWH